MTGSQKEKSPLACLVLFIIGVSVLGTILAGAHYFAIDLPKQQNVNAPKNSYDLPCHQACFDIITKCYDPCNAITGTSYADVMAKSYCQSNCNNAYFSCNAACPN